MYSKTVEASLVMEIVWAFSRITHKHDKWNFLVCMKVSHDSEIFYAIGKHGRENSMFSLFEIQWD